jgi:hypothetical protein
MHLSRYRKGPSNDHNYTALQRAALALGTSVGTVRVLATITVIRPHNLQP